MASRAAPLRSDGFRRNAFLNRDDTNGFDENLARLRLQQQARRDLHVECHGAVVGCRQWLRRLVDRQFARHAIGSARARCPGLAGAGAAPRLRGCRGACAAQHQHLRACRHGLFLRRRLGQRRSLWGAMGPMISSRPSIASVATSARSCGCSGGSDGRRLGGGRLCTAHGRALRLPRPVQRRCLPPARQRSTGL